jgi:YidC/Oxa1 family membrane protein insertase
MIAGLFEPPAALLAWFYSFTHNYIIAISMIALVIMIITAPLVLKSTKGMLEMQKLQPEMRKLQQEHRGDRQKLNEEMMKLYQQHKVNPMASCFPLLLQMPVFIIMYRVLHGLTNRTKGLDGYPGFTPRYISTSSKLYQNLKGDHEMLAWGLDLARRPSQVIAESFGKGLIYALLVVSLGVLYYAQQKMVAARAQVAPNMSETQAKLMQYLPVVFAVFLVFYLTGLVIYYMAQAIFRIGLQYYITHRFYKGEHSLGRQAQAAGERAREIAKKDGGGGGMFAQAKRQLTEAKQAPAKAAGTKPPTVSKRVTPPKNRPTSSNSSARPASTGKSVRPNSARPKKK